MKERIEVYREILKFYREKTLAAEKWFFLPVENWLLPGGERVCSKNEVVVLLSTGRSSPSTGSKKSLIKKRGGNFASSTGRVICSTGRDWFLWNYYTVYREIFIVYREQKGSDQKNGRFLPNSTGRVTNTTGRRKFMFEKMR